MLRDMGQFDSANFDPAAMSNGRYLPVESAMPGTTLGIIPLQAFASGGTLYGRLVVGSWSPPPPCFLARFAARALTSPVFPHLSRNLSPRRHPGCPPAPPGAAYALP